MTAPDPIADLHQRATARAAHMEHCGNAADAALITELLVGLAVANDARRRANERAGQAETKAAEARAEISRMNAAARQVVGIYDDAQRRAQREKKSTTQIYETAHRWQGAKAVEDAIKRGIYL